MEGSVTDKAAAGALIQPLRLRLVRWSVHERSVTAPAHLVQCVYVTRSDWVGPQDTLKNGRGYLVCPEAAGEAPGHAGFAAGADCRQVKRVRQAAEPEGEFLARAEPQRW